jgi:hypothetical protein
LPRRHPRPRRDEPAQPATDGSRQAAWEALREADIRPLMSEVEEADGVERCSSSRDLDTVRSRRCRSSAVERVWS